MTTEHARCAARDKGSCCYCWPHEGCELLPQLEPAFFDATADRETRARARLQLERIFERHMFEFDDDWPPEIPDYD